MNDIIDNLSYKQIANERKEFIRSGTKNGSEFNRFETPLNTYFKILFHFYNGDSDYENGLSGGLLAPTWSTITDDNYYVYNSAWSYLKMNGEEERADKLKQFVNLLSNISSEAPWTFTSISGLDSALERDINDKEFKISEERKKISIKCLPDSYDTRIGTLLDLYKDIVWSWKTKREIVPSNLRKFDMSIYIYSDPIKNIHQAHTQNSSVLNADTSSIPTSYKYIEFHNCEFDYNSSKSGYGELNNSEGNSWEYTIDISFDDAYELRYNEFMMRKIGDMIEYDTNMAITSRVQNEFQYRADELEKRINMYNNDSFVGQVIDELSGAVGSVISNKIHNAILGNLFTASLPTISAQIQGAAKGHVFATANAVNDYVNGNYKPNAQKSELGNLFSKLKNI